MKTERRHELQTNALADWLAHEIEKVKPYSKAILGVIVAVVVIIGASMYLRSRASAKQEEGWDQYFAAAPSIGRPDAQKLMEVGQEHQNTSVGNWSRLLAADVQLDDGTGKMFSDRAAARVELNKAIENYQAVLDGSREPLYADRARFGLGQAYEALDDLPKARENYELVVKAGDKSPYASAAKQRLDDLSKKSTNEFYDWFARYQVKSTAPTGLGLPGSRPDFDLNKLPDVPDFKPSTDFNPGVVPDAKKPGEAAPGETKPAEAKPVEKAETKQPAETKPAETKADATKSAEAKPADTKPAATEPADTKPADTKPAETKPAESAPEKDK